MCVYVSVCMYLCAYTGMGRGVPVVAHHMVCGVFGSLSGWCKERGGRRGKPHVHIRSEDRLIRTP